MNILLLLVFIAGFEKSFAQQSELIMTIGGDVNFSKHRWPPNENGVGQGSRAVPFEQMTRGLLPLIRGADVNFANIETVVTDRPLRPLDKAFNFQMHPQALQHLIDIGYNLFSLANNHSHDYGLAGILQTLNFSRSFERSRNVAFSGLGESPSDVTTPSILIIRGVRIGFLAYGNTSFLPTARSAGVLSYNSEAHIQEGLRNLREANVDLRIVSIHTGTERRTDLDQGQRQKFNRMLALGDVDLIIGHHPHVVRPIENVDGRFIFYSLGNYLMVGSANITRNPLPIDFGLMAKIFFTRDSVGKLQISGVQAIPLTNTNAYVQQLSPELARARVLHLNQLSRRNLANEAVQFRIHEETGTGEWLRSQDPLRLD